MSVSKIENAAFAPKVGLRHRPQTPHDIVRRHRTYSVVRREGSGRAFTVRSKNIIPLKPETYLLDLTQRYMNEAHRNKRNRPVLSIEVFTARRLFQVHDTVALKRPPAKSSRDVSGDWQKLWLIDGFNDAEASAYLSRADGVLATAPATDLVWRKGKGFPMKEILVDEPGKVFDK